MNRDAASKKLATNGLEICWQADNHDLDGSREALNIRLRWSVVDIFIFIIIEGKTCVLIHDSCKFMASQIYNIRKETDAIMHDSRQRMKAHIHNLEKFPSCLQSGQSKSCKSSVLGAHQ